jgi:vacuolar-type H+-ATPase subunit E/Vma4
MSEKAIVRRLRETAAAARIGEVTPPASLFDDAADEIARLAALPPLRAREEIARALAKPITGFPFDMLLEEQQAELLKAADAVCALSRTAGQEWRDREAMIREFIRRQKEKLETIQGATQYRNGYGSALDAFTRVLDALPAPPVAEPKEIP